MLDEQNRQMLPAMQIADQLDHMVGLLLAHAGGRLVEQQQFGPAAQRHRHLDDALVAMRQFADGAVGAGGETRRLQEFVHPLVDTPPQAASGPGTGADIGVGLDADADILEHR
jgi:hypothetical protein